MAKYLSHFTSLPPVSGSTCSYLRYLPEDIQYKKEIDIICYDDGDDNDFVMREKKKGSLFCAARCQFGCKLEIVGFENGLFIGLCDWNWTTVRIPALDFMKNGSEAIESCKEKFGSLL